MLREENWRDIGYEVQIGEKWCVRSTNSLFFFSFSSMKVK